MIALDGLPGEDLVRRGLSDLANGEESVEALLVSIARPRMMRCEVDVPAMPPTDVDLEIRLYRILGATHGREAYTQYNALLRRLVSFERALEQRWWNRRRKEASK